MDKEQFFDVFSQAKVYDLEQPRYFGAPVPPALEPGFVYTLNYHHEEGTGSARTIAGGTIYTVEHAGTHIDALNHIAENLTLYGGRKVTPQLQTSTGIYIMENLFLEDLARDQIFEFLFVCLPLKMQGATGSPIRPIAVVPQQ